MTRFLEKMVNDSAIGGCKLTFFVVLGMLSTCPICTGDKTWICETILTL